MKPEEFKAAFTAMEGLLPPMVEQLLALADHLPEKELARAHKKLSQLNDKLVANREKASEMYQQGIDANKKFEQQTLPKMRSAHEELEHAAAMKQAEKGLK